MKDPFFSICIPNYNYAHFIKKTIDSVLIQDFTDFEIIVCDNASTDNSIEVIKEYKDRRIKLIRNKYNVGFSHNLDRATRNAIGEFIILLSADDIMKKNALKRYYSTIQKFDNINNLVLMSSYEIIDGEETIKDQSSAKFPTLTKYLNDNNKINYFDESRLIEVYKGLDIVKALFTIDLFPAGPFMTTCYSKLLYDKVEGYSNIMSVLPDAHFSHKLCLQNPDVIYVNECLFQYRIHQVDHSQHGSKLDIRRVNDMFQIANSYSENELSKAGISRDQLIKTFVNNNCLKTAYATLLSGKIKSSLYYYILGLIYYPKLMIKNPRFYIIPVLFIIAPIFLVIKFFRNSKRE